MDIAEIGRQFGLDEAQTRAAFERLAPVVAAGIRRNNQTDDGLANLLKALQAGSHGQYADDPSALQYDQVADDGNAILGHVFGSKDVSRGVANQAADLSGVSSAVLKKMLPVIATIIMGQLAKGMFGGKPVSANAPAPAPAPGGSGGGLGDILGSILGGVAKAPAPQRPAPGGAGQGGGLGDIIGDILAGGGRGQAAPQGSPGGGGLGDILGDILGGGAAAGGSANAPRPQAGGQGGASLEDLLREMMGGGQGGAGGNSPDITQRSRKTLDDVLGGGTSTGNAADDLLNSVDRMTRRR